MAKNLSLAFAVALLLSAVALGQEAPQDLNYLLDEDTGSVNLMWRPPLTAVEYYEDFEDGLAQDFVYDHPNYWSVQNGKLTADFHPTGFYTYISAMYQGEQFIDGYTEVEVSKTNGNLDFAKWLFIHTDTPFTNDGGSNGYVLSIAESGGTGMVLVGKYIDGATLALLPWTEVDYVNTGHGADNIMAFYADDDIYTAVVNGVPVFTFADTDNPAGYIGVGMAEEIGQFGWVEWEYMAHDQPGIAALLPQSRNDQIASGDCAVPILPDEWMRAPALTSHTAKRTRTRLSPLLGTGFRPVLPNDPVPDDLIEYRIYREGDLRGVTTSNSYTDVLQEHGEYEYLVTAYWDEGESDYSNPITVTWFGDANWLLDENFDAGMPQAWTLEGETPSGTWMHSSLDPNNLDIFPTPYMLLNSEAAGAHVHVQSRLISPELGISTATNLDLYCDCFFDEYANEYLQISWSDDPSGDWTVLASFEYDFGPETVHQDLSDLPWLTDSIWISWYYDDQDNWGWYAAVDNVKCIAEYPDPFVSFSITPHQTDLPAEGGTLYYDVDFEGYLPDGQPNLRYWTTVTTPYGYEFGPLVEFVFGVQSSFAFNVEDLSQSVPWYAPAGEYTFTGHVGSMLIPQYRLTDSFNFEKFAGGPAMFPFLPEDWPVGGTWPGLYALAEDSNPDLAALPGDYSMGAAYPNPFNPTTTLSVALPETANLTVVAYNVAGQQVAEIANGQYTAGQHNLTFDASNLASGLYFIRAMVPGQMNATQKVMLVR